MQRGHSYSTARAVNATGNVVVERSQVADTVNADGTTTPNNNQRAFRWTVGNATIPSVMTDLGTLLGDGGAYAYGVNAAGDSVVGASNLIRGANRTFRWTAGSGGNPSSMSTTAAVAATGLRFT